MTSPPPNVFAVETDSAWVVILFVSLVTTIAALCFRRLIGRPGGLASGVLLLVPLLLPLLSALAFAQAVLPEFSVLRPASPSLLARSSGLLHLLLLRDANSNVVTPYTLTGTAGPWLVLIGGIITAYALVRRAIGTVMVHRLIGRCRAPETRREMRARMLAARVARVAGVNARPTVLVLPPGVTGAFAVGGKTPRILVSEEILEVLDDSELEATIAHEIAHIEAHDVPIVFTAGLLRDLVAWNPLAHVAFRRLLHDREIEADRRAAAITGKPLDVASGLLKVCELMKTSRRQRFALSFGARRGALARRVSGLLALADGRVVAQSRAGSLYVFAAVTVATLGLHAGAAVADHDLGAVAIVWGSPQSDATEMWAPKTARHLHGVARGPHKVSAPRDARSARLARRGRPPRYPELTVGISVRERNLPEWIRWMSRRVDRVPPASLRWEGRQDWNMIPIVTSGLGVRVYRLDI